jgi:hypothetical protein
VPKLQTLALSAVGLLALSVAACGGRVASEDDGTQINDATTSQGISSATPSPPVDGANGANGANGNDDGANGNDDGANGNDDGANGNDDSANDDGENNDDTAGHQDGPNDDHADRDDDREHGDDHEKCNGNADEKHHQHRHHRFHVLDGLDGTKDRRITIASLPAGLPQRLLARLGEIDSNGDGVVTKDEAKAWSAAHAHHRRTKKH